MKALAGAFILLLLSLLTISGCEQDITSSESNGKDTIYIGSIDTIVYVDTILSTSIDTIIIQDSIIRIDTILTVVTDSIITIDTVHSISYDTIHSIDTIFIVDTTDADTVFIQDTTRDDTLLVNQKSVFFISVEFIKNNVLIWEISCHNFSGEVPKLLKPSGEFTLTQEGTLSYEIEKYDYDENTQFAYQIASNNDTLEGTLQVSDFMIDSITINGDTTFYRRNMDNYSDSLWLIDYDFGTSLHLTWDRDTVSYNSYDFTGTTSGYPWISAASYDIVSDTTITKNRTTYAIFPVHDPLLSQLEGTFTISSGVYGGMKPDTSSATMEVYYIVKQSNIDIQIVKPNSFVDGLYHVSDSGWTIFEDSLSKNLTVYSNVNDELEHNSFLRVTKNGSGYGIAHGSVGWEGTATSMRKLKKVYIRYLVKDMTDTVSLALTSGIATATDTTTWSSFRAVLTSGCSSPGSYVVDVLELDDFHVNWGNNKYPIGTTLADYEAMDFLDIIDGFSITQETENSSDTTFQIEIRDLIFIGGPEFYNEAVKGSFSD